MKKAFASVEQRVMVASLTLLLASCGTTRQLAVGPANPGGLSKYALVFEQRPEGEMTHTWVPLQEFDPTKLQHAASTMNIRRDIVKVSSGLDAYCDGRHEQCERDCLESGKPFVIGYRKYMDARAQPWRIARGWWCPRNCLDAAVECKKGVGEWAESHAAEFDDADSAIDWIKKHRTELVVGAVVVIAGVSFAVVAVGSGGMALALAPLLFMTDGSPETSSGTRLAGACR